ncbi:peptidylprolyl isomerase [Clostridioides difficile]|nr:peptidylprolyl isomerase [Clostridioides difficile]EGT5012529.1 peptidylprolyl isomerase [Clostridioides difficile]
MKKVITLVIAMILVVSVTACSSSKGETVATVEGTKISSDEFKKTIALYKDSMEQTYGKDIWDKEVEKGVKYKDKFKDLILDQLITTEVIYSQAKKDNLLPKKEDVEKSFKELKDAMGKDEKYKEQLKKLGIDDEFLRDQQEKDLAMQNYQSNFAKKTKISDEEMKKYYDTHKDEFKKDEVEASHILLKTVDDNNKPLSDKEKAEAKKKAEEALKEVKSGEDFAKVAKKYSQDASASDGGKLGFFSRGQMVAEFEDAAFSMKKGEISDLVETQYGYHIIKVTDRINEQTSFEDAKETIKEQLLKNKYQEQIEKLTKEAKVEKDEKVIDKITI